MALVVPIYHAAQHLGWSQAANYYKTPGVAATLLIVDPTSHTWTFKPMRSPILAAATAISTLPLLASAAVGDACSANGTPGVCLSTSTCTSGSGTTHTGFCPNDPADVKCCTKSCGTGGQCRLVSSCPSGNTLSGMRLSTLPFLCASLI
jgi:hypothetical protein